MTNDTSKRDPTALHSQGALLSQFKERKSRRCNSWEQFTWFDMYNGMYGSPFPKLNPRVPYKTALERAGFEVNKGGNPHQNTHSNDHSVHFRGYGTGGQPSMSMGNEASNIDNLNTNIYVHDITNNTNSNTHTNLIVPNVQIHITAPSETSTVVTSHNSKIQLNSSSNNNNNKDSSNSLFDFEQTRNVVSRMDPIEKSFHMLTQRDSDCELSTIDNNDNGRENKDTENSNDNDQNLKYCESKIKTVDFKPNDNLHVSMHPDDETIPLRWNSDKNIDRGEKHASGNVANHIDSTVISNSIESQSSTNMNVEQLIAQLDDVSFSRNAKLNPPTSINNNNSCNSGGVDGSLNPGDGFKLKKSSAYLSGFPNHKLETSKPQLNTDSIHKNGLHSNIISSTSDNILPQNITVNTAIKSNDKENINISGQDMDVNVYENDINKNKYNDSSSIIGTTPTFYKFKQNINPSFYSSSTSLLLPREDQPTSKLNNNSDSGGDGCNNCDSLTNSGNRTKYPPGEGPCRTCGLEIVTKGVYSKKPGELSGQWHKKCFKCTDCNIIFNKLIPCYILNDMPYCQRHYHENNHSICKECNDVIEGECLENDKKERYHVNCLKCFLCKRVITQDYFIFNDEIPLCSNHDMDSLISKGLTLSNNNDEFQSQSTQKENTVRKRRTRLINFQEQL